MKKKFERLMRGKRFILLVLAWTTVALVFALTFAPYAAAQPAEAAPFSDFINKIINLGRGLAATLAVLMLVVGAIRLKASAGNPESQRSAKMTIAAAVSGLLLALFAPDIIRVITSAKPG